MKCLWYFLYVISFHVAPKCQCYTLSLTGSERESTNNRIDAQEREWDYKGGTENNQINTKEREWDYRRGTENNRINTKEREWDYRRGTENNRINTKEREWDYRRGSDRDKDTNKDNDSRFKGWNYVDTSEEWQPHKKTISFHVLEEPPYYHGDRPLWPNDEYMYGHYGSPIRNGSDSNVNSSKPDANKMDYEWQNLPHRYSGYYGYPGHHTHHHHTAAANDVTKLDTTDAQGTSTDKRHLGYGYNGLSGYGYGNRYPYGGDYYGGYGGRKRFRLQINPALIAAPLAGLAAYKVAQNFNPLLVELGIIDKGRGFGTGWGYPQYPPYRPPPILPPSYPPISTYPPIGAYPPISTYPPVVPPLYGNGGTGTPYPILIPKRQETEKSSWWNPFSSLMTPRDEEKNDIY